MVRQREIFDKNVQHAYSETGVEKNYIQNCSREKKV